MKPIAWAGLLVIAALVSRAGAADGLHFETDVRPILKQHCFHCHGEAGELSGGLDLRLVRTATEGGDSGPAIVVGDPRASELLRRIDAGEMPPSGKRLPPEDREILAAWIAAGAPTLRPEPESIDEQMPWTVEELSHWAYQPVVSLPAPEIVEHRQARGPIDAWLLQELQRHGESFSAEAEPATLLRRLTLDLTGLPPDPSEVLAFEQDARPDAYERQVDRLLASPSFGERWARHWLDVAGYADSEGYLAEDPARAWAYRYRDWVIDAFDSDLPFERFVISQLAGDELNGVHAGALTQEQIANLTATGFLRMVPDGTGGGVDDPLMARHDVISETLKVVSSGLLGLTVGCARCHDHRYDPISQRDYFALAAVFEPAFDIEQWRNPSQRLVNLWTPEDHAAAAAVDARVAEVEKRYLEELDALVAEIFERKVSELSPELQEAARLAKTTPAEERTEEQRALLREYPSLNVDRGSATLYEPGRVSELDTKRRNDGDTIRKERPAEQFVACLTEVPNRLPKTYLLFRGEPKQPREEMLPADLSVLGERKAAIPEDDTNLATSGRRLAWARSLVSGTHPLVGRVWVNRLWAHHFGSGIVPTLGDFGKLGEAPSHGALLDHLATELFRWEGSSKLLHRRMVTTSAYRQSSVRRETLDQIDPDNRLWGRASVKRLEAEAIRDAMLAVTGELFARRFGPAIPVTQDEIGRVILGTGARDGNGILVGREESLGAERFRRSVYVQVRRTMPLGVLEPFDPATLDPNCTLRDRSTGPNQALQLLNGQSVIERSRRLAESVRREAPDDARAQFELAWSRAFGSQPSEGELLEGLAFLVEQQSRFEKVNAAESSRLALETLCQALLASNRFLYVE